MVVLEEVNRFYVRVLENVTETRVIAEWSVGFVIIANEDVTVAKWC